MARIFSGAAGGGGDAYTYVQDSEPSNAEEGESWYDTGANAAYVYDGAAWIDQTVADHSELSGIDSSDHHTRPSSTNSEGQNTSLYKIAGNQQNTSNVYQYTKKIKFYVASDYSDSVTVDYGATLLNGSNISGSITTSSSSYVTDTFYPNDVVESTYMNSSSGGTYTKTKTEVEMGRPNHSHSI